MTINTSLQSLSLRYMNSLSIAYTNVPSTNRVPRSMVAAFDHFIREYGYKLSGQAVDVILTNVPADKFVAFAQNFTEAFRAAKKANLNYAPMYKNFPSYMSKASEIELFINAFVHYYAPDAEYPFIPDYTANELRTPLNEKTDLTEVGVDAYTSEGQLVIKLLELPLSLPENDIALIREWVDVDSTSHAADIVVSSLGHTFPNKQNFANLASLHPIVFKTVLVTAKTATDVLRAVVAYSGSPATLFDTKEVRFKLSTSLSKHMTSVLEELYTNNPDSFVEDVARHRGLWKRLLRNAHLNAYTKNQEMKDIFRWIHSSQALPTWNSQYEAAFAYKDYDALLRLLSARPGEFVRHAVALIDNANKEQMFMVESALEEVAHKASTTTLWNLISHINSLYANKDGYFSVVNVKGRFFARGVKHEENVLRFLSVIADVAERALIKVYTERHKDEPYTAYRVLKDDTANLTVPFNLHTYNSTERVIGRGSRVKYDSTKTLRFFMHWWNIEDSRVDLDLSAALYDEDFNLVNYITYYNLRSEGLGYHSGDITNAAGKNGASEFIDIAPTAEILASNSRARYIVMDVRSFTGQKLSQMKAYAGFMSRKNLCSGENYEPTTVQESFNVNSDATHIIPMVFDILKSEMIWIDAPNSAITAHSNVHRDTSGTKMLLKGLTSKRFTTVEDVFLSNYAHLSPADENTDESQVVTLDLTESGKNLKIAEFLQKYL